MNIKIANKLIGKDQPCFIIAEAGVNHNGSLKLAKKLIDVAKYAGADAIKFQTFKASNLVVKDASMAEYQQKNIGKKQSQQEMLKKLELKYEHFKKLKKYCDKKKIIFLSTPHSDDAIDFLENLVPAYKIGSGDLTNFPFLKKIAEKKKPVILSTGMSTLEEVKDAVNTIKKIHDKIILLHCTTSYPCDIKDVNLGAMETLSQEFNLPTGYSDHTLGIEIPIMAASLGAILIEKHFTLDKNMEGPDHKASLNPEELKQMVEKIRNKDYPELNEVVLGSKEKKPTEKEREIAKVVRKSIVAAKDIEKGEKITEDKISVKRPGTGISPKYLNKVIGRISKENIKKDEIIDFRKLK